MDFLFDTHWFSFRDCCIAVLESRSLQAQPPEQETLFFLHGRFGHAETWLPTIQKIIPKFRCFSIDFPGFGRSFATRAGGLPLVDQATLVSRVVQRFVPEGRRAVLVGHDVGGVVAQLCALHSPELISGIVLVNSTCLTRGLNRFPIDFMGWNVRRKLRRLFRASTAIQSEDRQTILIPWKKPMSRFAMIAAFRVLEASWPTGEEQERWKEALRDLHQPALLLWGRKDTLNPPELAVELIQRLPDAYLSENAEVGHWPNLECPEWVSQKLREFMFRLIPEPVQRAL